MKTRKLALKIYLCFAFVFYFQSDWGLQIMANAQDESEMVLFLGIGLCCSFKMEKLDNQIMFSAVIGK